MWNDRLKIFLKIQKCLLSIQALWKMSFKTILQYNPKKNTKNWIHSMIWLLVCEALEPVVIKIFISIRRFDIFLYFYRTLLYFVVVTQSYFSVPKNIILNSTHYFITETLNKQEIWNTGINYSSDIQLNDFMKIYKKMYYGTIFLFSQWYYFFRK